MSGKIICMYCSGDMPRGIQHDQCFRDGVCQCICNEIDKRELK